jgi:predicted RND superfamily exporter protein
VSVWTSRFAPWSALAVAGVAVVTVILVVDLSPEVEGDFFFSDSDPQMRASQEVASRFPSGAQLILRVADLGGDSDAYQARVAALTVDLLSVSGVEGGYSIATEDPGSPLFRRILLSPDSTATNIVLQVDDTAPEVLLPRVEEVVASHSGAELEIVVSGVPAIVELIRRSLYRDLIVFSIAAVLVFALLIGLVYRDPAIVAGTLSTCLVAVGVTLLVVEISNIGIGLLTANLVTIVFVLTLSHVVFLTGNWRRAGASPAGVGPEGHAAPGREALLRQALADTWEGSFWSMATTLLGFTSLLIATARPLRELGVAGAVGSVTALVVAYLVYPAFLGSWARAPTGEPTAELPIPRPTGTRGVLPVAFMVVAAVAVGVPTIDTDPGLLSYFAEGSSLREGLARIDADGGSSTLDIVVTDPGGEAVSAPTVYPRLEALQATLEADAAVGVVLSPVVLIEHARTIPLAGLLPVRALLDIASSDALGGVGLGFVTPDGREARFALRMRETTAEARDSVTNRLRMGVEAAGLEPVVIAGLYDLQAQLGRLLASSLRIGIGGLLLLFAVVAVVVARAPRVAAAMWVCLAAIPLVILGTFGHAGVAMDIITSPAANIALAVGADSMIHLVVRVRRLGDDGVTLPWIAGVAQIGRPVLGATSIVCAGFGIFALSSFPPTQRFGFAVIVGTLTAAVMAVLILPRLACLRSVRADSLSAS